MRTTKCEIHKDHDVFHQIEDKDDYGHLLFEVMTHKLLTVEEKSSIKNKNPFY